jgi:hypothetical protein
MKNKIALRTLLIMAIIIAIDFICYYFIDMTSLELYALIVLSVFFLLVAIVYLIGIAIVNILKPLS